MRLAMDREAAYRAKRRTPRADDRTRLPPDSVTVLSPLSSVVYVFSNAMVGHAARVHANAGPAVSVAPDSVKAPPQMLQSARVERRPSANVRTYDAPFGTACSASPAD